MFARFAGLRVRSGTGLAVCVAFGGDSQRAKPTSATATASRSRSPALHTYQLLSGMPIDPERLAWGRTVHALRAMTEIGTWEHQDRTDAYSGHPWMAMRSVLEAQLATVTD